VTELVALFGQLSRSLNLTGDGVNWIAVGFNVLTLGFQATLEIITAIPKLIMKGVLAFKDFIGGWQMIPITLDAAFGTVKTFFSKLVKLSAQTGENIGNIFKEGFDFKKLMSGDLSGVRAARNKAMGDLSSGADGIGPSSMSAEFSRRMRENELGYRASLKASMKSNGGGGGGGFADVLRQMGLNIGGVGVVEKDKKKSGTTVDEIKSGRPTNIYINIGKLIETFNVTATNLDAMNNKVKDLVSQALMSSVNNANLIAK
jgi:hypothetical protein